MKKFLNRLFYVPKYVKLTDENIKNLMLPSLIGIVVCATCLVGLTMAWFSANVQTAPQRLTAASFSVTAEITKASGANTGYRIETGEHGAMVFVFQEAGDYTVNLTAHGGGNGWCRITAGDAAYDTRSFRDRFSFKVQASGEGTGRCALSPAWGIHDGLEAEFTLRVDLNPEEAPTEQTQPEETKPETTEPEQNGLNPDGTYTVRAGDVLSVLAERFGTTTEKLAAYNGLTDVSTLEVGKCLSIPPADYEIPAQTVPAEPAETEATQPTASEPSQP